MRKTLILVLSAVRQPWLALMNKQRATWDSIPHPQTDTLYYVGGFPEKRVDDRILYSTIDEHLHNIGRRTVEAFEYALTLPGWQYLARPHSSTYVRKRQLVEFVDTLPETGAMMGAATPHEGVNYLWGGGHMTYSRDVIEALVAAKENWNHKIMEDVAVSRLAQSLGISFGVGRSASIDWQPNCASVSCTAYNGETGGFGFTDWNDLNRLKDQFFFRVKFDPDRAVDLKTMDLLFKHLER